MILVILYFREDQDSFRRGSEFKYNKTIHKCTKCYDWFGRVLFDSKLKGNEKKIKKKKLGHSLPLSLSLVSAFLN